MLLECCCFSFITETAEQSPEMLKKRIFKNFPKFTGKHLCQSLFFNKVAGLKLYLKKALAQVLSSEFCSAKFLTIKIVLYFTEHLWTAAPVQTNSSRTSVAYSVKHLRWSALRKKLTVKSRYFLCKMLHLRYLTGSWKRHWISEITSFSQRMVTRNLSFLRWF